MSDAKTDEPKTVTLLPIEPKPTNWFVRELKSRKYRAYLAGAGAIVAAQFTFVQHVWAVVVLCAGYIVGVAIEDHATKSAKPGDTNINLPDSSTPLTVRTRRVSKDPMGITTTEEVSAGPP